MQLVNGLVLPNAYDYPMKSIWYVETQLCKSDIDRIYAICCGYLLKY